MIDSSTPAQSFALLVKAVFDRAPAYGYKKSGSQIKKIAYGNAAIIEFQRSRDNTKNRVKFTLNVAIVSGEMLKIDGLMFPFGTTLQSAKSATSHLRLRIGQIAYGYDKWWEIDTTTDIEGLISELNDTTYHKAVPYIERYIKNEDLLNLWISNGYHGLTLGMRDRYIEALSKIVSKNAE